MNKQDFVNAVILKVSGKAQELLPNSPKYNKIIGIAARYVQAWQNEPGVDWKALYQMADFGRISSYGDVDFPSNVRKVSDDPGASIHITTTNGQVIKYKTADPHDLDSQSDEKLCAVVGRKIIFPKAFTASDPEYGARVSAPAYLYVSDFAKTGRIPTGIIPEWLIFITAAEYGRNDILKRSEYNNMVNEANQLMRRMIADNGGQQRGYKVGGGFKMVGRTW